MTLTKTTLYLPEVDYLLSAHVSERAEERFVADLASGAWAIEWGDPADLLRAEEIGRHRALHLRLVDSVVMAVAERRKAGTIAKLDLCQPPAPRAPRSRRAVLTRAESTSPSTLAAERRHR